MTDKLLAWMLTWAVGLAGPQKFDWVFEATVRWCRDCALDVRTSVLNALIEVAVVSLTPASRADA